MDVPFVAVRVGLLFSFPFFTSSVGDNFLAAEKHIVSGTVEERVGTVSILRELDSSIIPVSLSLYGLMMLVTIELEEDILIGVSDRFSTPLICPALEIAFGKLTALFILKECIGSPKF